MAITSWTRVSLASIFSAHQDLRTKGGPLHTYVQSQSCPWRELTLAPLLIHCDTCRQACCGSSCDKCHPQWGFRLVGAEDDISCHHGSWNECDKTPSQYEGLELISRGMYVLRKSKRAPCRYRGSHGMTLHIGSLLYKTVEQQVV